MSHSPAPSPLPKKRIELHVPSDDSKSTMQKVSVILKEYKLSQIVIVRDQGCQTDESSFEKTTTWTDFLTQKSFNRLVIIFVIYRIIAQIWSYLKAF